jgi:hypothetical protein
VGLIGVSDIEGMVLILVTYGIWHRRDGFNRLEHEAQLEGTECNMYHNNRHNYTQLYCIYTLTTPIHMTYEQRHYLLESAVRIAAAKGVSLPAPALPVPPGPPGQPVNRHKDRTQRWV